MAELAVAKADIGPFPDEVKSTEMGAFICGLCGKFCRYTLSGEKLSDEDVAFQVDYTAGVSLDCVPDSLKSFIVAREISKGKTIVLI